jgi:ABC-2 type transport system ATP-binding protein
MTVIEVRGLAGALLGEPEVLILDEPANGLDPAGVLWLRGFLRRLGDEGRTVLVSSHILAEVAQFADHAIVIDRGRLVSAGPVTELIKATQPTVVVRTPRAEALRAALISVGAAVQAAGPDRLEVTGLDTEQVATLAAALGIPIFEMTEDTGSLEQAFLRLTAAEGRPG